MLEINLHEEKEISKKRLSKENMEHVSVLNQVMAVMSIHVENPREENYN